MGETAGIWLQEILWREGALCVEAVDLLVHDGFVEACEKLGVELCTRKKCQTLVETMVKLGKVIPVRSY